MPLTAIVDIVAKIIPTAIGLLGAHIFLFNWYAVFKSIVSGKNISTVPIGGAFLAIGLASYDITRPFWYLALLFDIGSWYLLFGLPKLAVESWQTSKLRRLRYFQGQQEKKTVILSLFKGDIWTADVKIELGKGETGLTQWGMGGTWHEKAGIIELSVEHEEYKANIVKEGDGFFIQAGDEASPANDLFKGLREVKLVEQ